MKTLTDTTRPGTDPGQPEAVFMMGGPGAGKSYARGLMFPGLPVVDTDQIKETHPDYDPKNPSALHAWSAKECVRAFFATLGTGRPFVYDGTGTNAEKMVNWMLRAQDAGYRVTLVYVQCSLHTALDRNRARTRVVPEPVVREKHTQVGDAFRLLRGYADRVVEVDNN